MMMIKEKAMLHLPSKSKNIALLIVSSFLFHAFCSGLSLAFDNKRFELLSGRKTGEEVKKVGIKDSRTRPIYLEKNLQKQLRDT